MLTYYYLMKDTGGSAMQLPYLSGFQGKKFGMA